MSKMDNMRAMREAKFERTTQAAAQRRPKPAALRSVDAAPAAELPATAHLEPLGEEPEEALCGHRAISGRTCTRERGHDSKSHRYA